MIWKRRLSSKKELRDLFQFGAENIYKCGDLISDTLLDVAHVFEKHSTLSYCKDAIEWSTCNYDEIAGMLSHKILVIPLLNSTAIEISSTELEFGLVDKSLNNDNNWICAYASHGVWNSRLLSKPLIYDVVRHTRIQIEQRGRNESGSYLLVIARLLDLVHPSHTLQSLMIAYPLNAFSILKKRLSSLGYELRANILTIGTHIEEVANVNATFAIDIIGQIENRLAKEHKYYFEFSCSDKVPWRAGFATLKCTRNTKPSSYPGETRGSFGVCWDGILLYNGESHDYFDDFSRVKPAKSLKTFGIIIDLYEGTISLIDETNSAKVAFGPGSSFPEDIQLEQNSKIKINFGAKPFKLVVDATPCNHILKLSELKSILVLSILENSSFSLTSDAKEKASQEEEEDKLQLVCALEKNSFRTALASEAERSFSQFPPSVYRRSLAATKIQRAWRIYRGRRYRRDLKEKMNIAASKIQRLARRALTKIRQLKFRAAEVIQRNWRKLLFYKIALLRSKYSKSIPELHRAATIIQRRYKRWVKCRTSPFDIRYRAKPEEFIKAVNKIICWWRPRYQRMLEQRKITERNEAAVTIQRVYRGYMLRKLLRSDIQGRLKTIGASLVKHRTDLLRLRSAFVIQRVWRQYRLRKIRQEKLRTRNAAATRIQALWKGCWVRSHTHLRFSYGQAVYLSAVCRALRNAHFILKIYKPCGIVCPKYENKE
ncbi:hypothetical protein BKA69DRAFT_1139007 [Paraphysoderma sedebokerense]|nr:hypothetical protein BKA69DRAFT_1139007 [Paraphysoderma sedebokerense]